MLSDQRFSRIQLNHYVHLLISLPFIFAYSFWGTLSHCSLTKAQLVVMRYFCHENKGRKTEIPCWRLYVKHAANTHTTQEHTIHHLRVSAVGPLDYNHIYDKATEMMYTVDKYLTATGLF